MNSTELSLRRYAFLHASIVFLVTSIQGFLIVKENQKGHDIRKHVNTHLDGYVAALWLAAVGASLDFSTLKLSLKRVLVGSVIIFTWVQFTTTYLIARYNLKLSDGFTGNQLHDGVLAALLFVLSPTALIGSLLWIAGFVSLHEGEQATTTVNKKRK